MENLLFVLALVGIVVGAFSLFLPSLRRRGVSLPFMRLVDDDEDDDVDIDEDLDLPLNKAFARSKEKQAKGEKKRRGSVIIPERFVASPGAEMAPLSAKGTKRPEPEAVVDPENPAIVFEKPNASLDPDELELDPELQALIETAAEDDAEGRELVAVAAGDSSGGDATAGDGTSDPAADPAPEAKADVGELDILSMFEETEVEDTRPPALREAIKPCTIEDLQAEAQAMRAILSGNHAA